MPRDWEATFHAWGQPPSKSEEDQQRRTEAEIRDALLRYEPLQDRRIRVYAKGSYRRGTNVRRGSDIDIAVELIGDVSSGESHTFEKAFDASKLSDADLGITRFDFPHTVDKLKTDVHTALASVFGSHAVDWSNKCIKVREGSELPADAVPCRSYRRYDGVSRYSDGIRIRADDGTVIINWPEQDDHNGTLKNTLTQRRFKRAVRGVKSLENEMVDKGIISVVPSFMMECAVYNVPDDRFNESSNFHNCLNVLEEMLTACVNPDIHNEWLEVNELKYLFRASQSWTVNDMYRLVDSAIDYIKNS
jgi:predicted nucleotidyltransferase